MSDYLAQHRFLGFPSVFRSRCPTSQPIASPAQAQVSPRAHVCTSLIDSNMRCSPTHRTGAIKWCRGGERQRHSRSGRTHSAPTRDRRSVWPTQLGGAACCVIVARLVPETYLHAAASACVRYLTALWCHCARAVLTWQQWRHRRHRSGFTPPTPLRSPPPSAVFLFA